MNSVSNQSNESTRSLDSAVKRPEACPARAAIVGKGYSSTIERTLGATLNDQSKALDPNANTTTTTTATTTTTTTPTTNETKAPFRVSCKARRMGCDHNENTAYIDIPAGAKHGLLLLCSHPGCRESGRQFRYCTVCKLPVTKRNFMKRHAHGIVRTPLELLDPGLECWKDVGTDSDSSTVAEMPPNQIERTAPAPAAATQPTAEASPIDMALDRKYHEESSFISKDYSSSKGSYSYATTGQSGKRARFGNSSSSFESYMSESTRTLPNDMVALDDKSASVGSHVLTEKEIAWLKLLHKRPTNSKEFPIWIRDVVKTSLSVDSPLLRTSDAVLDDIVPPLPPGEELDINFDTVFD